VSVWPASRARELRGRGLPGLRESLPAWWRGGIAGNASRNNCRNRSGLEVGMGVRLVSLLPALLRCTIALQWRSGAVGAPDPVDDEPAHQPVRGSLEVNAKIAQDSARFSWSQRVI
jgi:hypothetical protein